MTNRLIRLCHGGIVLLLAIAGVSVAVASAGQQLPTFYQSIQRSCSPSDPACKPYEEIPIAPDAQGKLTAPWGTKYDASLFSGMSGKVKFNQDLRNDSHSIVVDPATPASIATLKTRLVQAGINVVSEWWVSASCGQATYFAAATYAHLFLNDALPTPTCKFLYLPFVAR